MLSIKMTPFKNLKLLLFSHYQAIAFIQPDKVFRDFMTTIMKDNKVAN